MKKMFLEDLPRWENGTNKGKIDWNSSIGYEVKFVYDNIEGVLPILDIIKYNNKNYLITEYKNHKNYKIYTDSFAKCILSKLLDVCEYNFEYKYKIGDIIDSVKSGKLKILNQIKIYNDNISSRGYEYECLICGSKDKISEKSLIDKKGCIVCSGHKILKGYNDLQTTHPEIAKMLKYPEVGYEISYGCMKKQIFFCPDCGFEKSIRPTQFINHGFSCPKCGDKVPYSEKLMFNILQQLCVDFKPQLNKFNLKWCKKYKYDFYIPSFNCIIETHGLQHYNESSWGARTLKEEKENDKLKQELALKNGVENYIVIDCRKSDLEFIKNNILNSNLSILLDFNQIDWLKCHEYACGSLVKVICDMWNKDIQNISEISRRMKLSRNTIMDHLKQGAKLGLCNYYVKKETAFFA